MHSIVNQYSFLIIGLIFFIPLAGFALRKGIRRSSIYILFGYIFIMGVLWTAIRPQPGVQGNIDAVNARIGKGTAVLVEFQSPY